jgi:hypothetical protein
MSTVMIDEERLKDLLKSAIVEALEERRDLVQEIVEEAMEDIGLAYAIEQGLRSDTIPREEVFAILKRNDN